MTTNSSIPAPSVHQPRRGLRWIPGSRTAWGILILGAAGATGPAFYAAGLAILGYACFDSCDTPVEITEWALVAVIVALSPLVLVRVYQGEHPASARGRLAVAVGLGLSLALAWCAWTGVWPG
jgi:hypothetical protein